NRGELTAIIKILEATRGTDHDLNILADSQYAINSITKWMPGWKKRGWKKADGKPVINQDLMIQLDNLMTEAQQDNRNITFQWVKGHAIQQLNEATNTRTNEIAKVFQTAQPADNRPALNLQESPAPSQNSNQTEKLIPPENTVTLHSPIAKQQADQIVHFAQK